MLQAPVASYRALPPLLHGALVPAVMPVCVVVRKCAVVRRHPQRSWNIWLLRKIWYLVRYLFSTKAESSTKITPLIVLVSECGSGGAGRGFGASPGRAHPE